MAGTVYLRTNRFEVKLEGITFKTKDFESLCKLDFLFLDEKVWARPPIVGLDVMRHPRDPSILLLLLCFGTGCVILKFAAGEALPAPVHMFFADKRVRFVGFGIPEKKDLFPFEALGLNKSEVDIGYLAAKTLKNPKYKRWELSELARKVLGIKTMIGLTEASSFERHEQIKCGICQLFITSVIAMGLLGANDKNKKMDWFSKKSSFLKNLNSLQPLAEGWSKLTKGKKQKQKTQDNIHDVQMDKMQDNVFVNLDRKMGLFVNCFMNAIIPNGDSGDCSPLSKVKEIPPSSSKEGSSSGDSGKEVPCETKKPLKGILKCPSTTLLRCNSSSMSKPATSPSPSPSTPSDSPISKPATSPSPSTPRDQMAAGGILKRANSKGYNVSFKFQ